MNNWHSLTLPEVFQSLGTGQEGLGSLEASSRLARFGYNELQDKKIPLWKKILEPFKSIFIIILLIAAIISFITGERLDGLIILVIVTINSAIYYSQQHATSRVIKSLKKYSEQFIQVIRDGQIVSVSSRMLVPGDVIILSEGQKVPADTRLTQEDNLNMDESALTGESLPVKKVVSTVSADKQLYERDNMVFGGTYVLSGSGQAVVTGTGQHSEFGAIAKLAVHEEPPSPMQHKINSMVSKLIKALSVVAIFVLALNLARGTEISEALRFVLAFIVSAVPEDLPIALTIVFVLGMRRMAKHKALVRSMSAIENLGLITIVATDKTGTLTKNQLEIAGTWAASQEVDLTKVSYLALGDENVLEPFDKAIKKFAHPSHQSRLVLLKKYPFNQEQRASGAIWEHGGKKTLYLKGAPEHMLNLCRLSDEKTHQAESQLRTFVANGFRVIALIRADAGSAPADLKDIGSLSWELLGLIAFADELRPESKASVMAAQQAGVSVKMITGDHFDTAFHIGRLLNISPHKDQVVQGSELPDTEAELEPYLNQKTELPRFLPKQKLKILKTLSGLG